jgi:hypothetical protein
MGGDATEGEESVTDQEVICAWMEPEPIAAAASTVSAGGWWKRYAGVQRSGPAWVLTPFSGPWLPRALTLDTLWEVEERLDAYQKGQYTTALLAIIAVPFRCGWTWHATPEQKIKALAAVLRPKDCSNAPGFLPNGANLGDSITVK